MILIYILVFSFSTFTISIAPLPDMLQHEKKLVGYQSERPRKELLQNGNKSELENTDDEVDAHQRHPKINPINPNLIAYEYKGNIEIMDKSTNAVVFRDECEEQEVEESTIGGLFEIQEGEDAPERSYFNCAYFDWRPILDQNGNYWFTYTSGVENALYIGYISYTLDKEIASYKLRSYQKFEIFQSADNQVYRPRWSPKGQYLIFNNGSGLYKTDRLYRSLREKDFESIDVSKIADHAYSAEWSPNGRYIIYEYSPPADQLDREERQGRLFLLDLEGPEPGEATTNIEDLIIRTGAMASERYKPRWSDSGNYLSFLIPSYTENNWDVKVVEVLYGENGEIEGLDSITGRVSRAFVENVFRGAELRSGYPITTLSGEDGSNEYLFVIKDDQANNNPIKIYPIDEETINEGVEKRSFTISSTNQNDNLDVVYDGSVTHLSYVSQVDGALKLQNVYMNSDVVFTEEPEITIRNVPKELSRGGAFFRSALFPGLGQFYKGETKKGLIFGGAAVLTTAGAIYLASNNSSRVSDFKSVEYPQQPESKSVSGIEDFYTKRQERYDQLKGIKSDIDRNNTFIIASVAVLAGVYLYNIYDSMRGFPIIRDRENNKIKLSLQPQVIPPLHDNDTFTAGLQFRLNFE